MAHIIHNIAPISDRGEPLIWHANRLFAKHQSKMLASGCRKDYYSCKSMDCKGTTSKTEITPRSNNFGEIVEGRKHADSCFGGNFSFKLMLYSNLYEDPLQLQVHLAKQQFKDACAYPGVSINQAYNFAIRGLDEQGVRIFGPQRKIEKTGYRVKSKLYPPIAEKASEVEIANEYLFTNEGDHHFMHKEVIGDDPEEVQLVFIAFATEDDFHFLMTSKTVYFDGTFKTCPKPFQQLFTIHSFFGNRSIPCIKVLMSHKSRQLYDSLFDWIKNKAHDLNCAIGNILPFLAPYLIFFNYRVGKVHERLRKWTATFYRRSVSEC